MNVIKWLLAIYFLFQVEVKAFWTFCMQVKRYVGKTVNHLRCIENFRHTAGIQNN